MSNTRFSPAIVTGGSGALGSAIARALLKAGSPVAIVARNEERLEAVAEELAALGTIQTVRADVTNPDDRKRIIDEVVAGLGSIGILINNAGAEFIGRLGQHDRSDVEHMVQMNLVAPIELTRLALPALVETRGQVINIVTMAAKTPMTPMSVYAATKSGLGKFTDLIGLELSGSGVAATAVYPGAIADEGMFATMRAETGVEFPSRMPLSSPDWVAGKVLSAIEHRRSEVFAAPAGAAMARHPRLAGKMLRLLGVADAFAEVADTREQRRTVQQAPVRS